MAVLAGAAEVKITPEVGTYLLGPVLRSTGVHDDLFARALVLSDGTNIAAVVCLDIIGLDIEFADEIRAAVTHKTGISTVILNCSHTHSAPFTIPWTTIFWERHLKEDVEWRTELNHKIADVVSDAMSKLQEVTLRVGRAPVQVGKNRRVPRDGGCVMLPNPDGPVVPWVDVLKLDDSDKNPVAVLFSHAAHPVIVHASSTLISADYPGFAASLVREKLGNGAIAMFAQGCGANINGYPLCGGIDAAQEAGTTLGQAVLSAIENSTPVPASSIAFASESLMLQFQDYPSIDECEEVIKSAREQLASEGEREDGGIRKNELCIQDLIEKARRNEQQNLRFEINALRIGTFCLITMPHEVFADYQLWAVENSPFEHTFVFGYTNGCESYIPVDSAFEIGGYEASLSPGLHSSGLLYRHRLAMRPGLEGQIKGGISRLWQRVGS